ncbi:tumor necrosis factor alpha-inducing protein [Helicobacter suis]|uniref:Tumor necrosis factor alpha-inducing protein n=1 Tax=Helicobacter suis TaxID=104628 RepID=A0A6J4CZM3_9HELI|nr:tumor necrosis factor alpha-inducing protein [Helicobacter suis]BCD49231.1 Tumor necrosis factor alpha-inducing protein [Helicobacter suis]BCD51264.1 Tumor necrosis factor alpha-inducing protein [Helicobacter suis]BCD70947.1 Tumor necrosis factor alpha-inducing protein [Helicobacter suis]BDR27994.1 tumor necrosis factor alpha-inducing protein [Helicobacter suis HS1]
MRVVLILLGVLLVACVPTHKKQAFLAGMPDWMVQDQSMYVTRGVDSSHVINGEVKKSEAIARERARFRVAIHIAGKIKDVFKRTQNANQKPYDDAIFEEITQAIANSLDKEEQLGEYINPNNQEVFMLVRVNSYSAMRLGRGLSEIKTLDPETIKQIMSGVQKVFNEAVLEKDAKSNHDFTQDRGGH